MSGYAPKNFSGGLHESGEFTSIERAQHRHMFSVMDANFVPLDDYELAGIRFLGAIRRSWYMFPVAFALGGAPKLWEVIVLAWGL